jgi:DNA polymerase-3 subunit gamma/tau
MPISRKYRPQSFKDVTGQQHITETLRKEVEFGMLGHAYLFSGPRGVGKTTTARIFAKALLNETTDHGEPPLDSEASKQVDLGNCIDFLEIDAATHTGVDHVREVIIEHVRFAPARWKRKVYVIDECHMLSAGAWNALLKTLEEPPEYAFFILATTELHKVPETIKSRCQRFEFKRILPGALVERIHMLANMEGIHFDDEVVHRIVRASDGCLRDAESLMDQLISLGSKKITSDIASLVLPLSMLANISKLFELATRRDLPASLAYAKQLIEEGMSPLEVLQDLLEVTRLLIRAQDAGEKKRLEEGDEGDRAIASLVGTCSLGELSEIALMLLERRKDIKVGTDPLFALELSLCAIAGGLLPHAGEGTKQFQASPASHIHVKTIDDEKKTQTKINNDQQKMMSEAPAEMQDLKPLINEAVPIQIETSEKISESQIGQVVAESDCERQAVSGEQTVDIHDVRKYWSLIIQEIEKENHSLPFILKVCQPDHLIGTTIYIRFQYSFHREKLLEDMKTRRVVENAIRRILKNEAILIDGFCQAKSEEGDTSLENAPMDVVSRVLGAFGGQVIE